MEYTTLQASTTKLEQFKLDVRTYVAAAAKISIIYVSVVSVKPGSVVVDTKIELPTATYTEAQVSSA